MSSTYKKGGSAGSKGIDFQVNLSTVILLNALRRLDNWKLSTENEMAAKFDDVVLELSDGSSILLQAKHKEKGKITLDQLLSTNSKTDDFSLAKYFFSFQHIKTKFLVKNIIVCTNANFINSSKYLIPHDVSSESMLHYEGGNCSFYTINNAILINLKEKIITYYKNNLQGKGILETIITDKNLTDFVKHLQLYTNYPAEKEIENVIQQLLFRLKYSSNLWYNASPQDIHNKIMNWFKQPRGYYLTKISTKAIFCDIKTDHYCQTLDSYNVFFQSSGSTFPDPKRIFHVTTEGGYLLQVMKIYQSLRNNKSKILYICPEDSIDVQKQVVEAFELCQYIFLVIIQPKLVKESEDIKIYCKLREILEKFQYKKVIIMCESNSNLIQHIETNNDNFNVINNSVTFEDLANDSQKKLLQKYVAIQKYDVSLEEILATQISEEYGNILDSEILEKLVRNEKIIVGSEVPLLDNHITHYYINRTFIKHDMDNDYKARRYTYYEKDIFGVKEQIVVISDSAGTGKSTVLTKLAEYIKEKNPHLWVIRIDLTDYTKILKDCLRNNIESITVAELLGSKDATKLKNNLEKFVFSMNKKVVLLLDGIDEISPDYTTLILNLLFECQNARNFVKIFVTTRPHMVDELEEILQVSSFKLQTFTLESQIEFLTNYWTHHLQLRDANKEKCELFARALTEKMVFCTISNHEFAGIPLQLRMLAEIFQERNRFSSETAEWEGCREYLNVDEAEPKLPEKVNVTKLYGMFMEKKRDIFMDKGNPNGNTIANEALIDKYNEYLAFHRSLALKMILEGKACELFSSYQRESKKIAVNVLNIGIVQKVEKEFNFVHRTFAEYFVAECVLSELIQNPDVEFQQFLIEEIFSNYKFNVVRTFVDSFLQEHMAALPSRTFKKYQLLENNVKNNPHLIHTLAKEGCVAVLQLILKCIDFEIIRDKETYTFLCRRKVSRNTLNALQFLTRLGGINIKDNKDMTPLQYTVENNDFNMSKFLVEQGANINYTVLEDAIVRHHVKLVRFFLETILQTNDLTADPIFAYTAAFLGRLDIIQILMQKGVDVNARIENGETLIFGATRGGQKEIIKYLVQQGANPNNKDNYGNTPLYVVGVDYLDIITCLVKFGADINNKDSKGYTPLHSAVVSGSLETVKCLAELGADVNIKNDENNTALHSSVKSGHLKTVRCILQLGADTDIKNSERYTALHLAAKKDDLNIIKSLVEYDGDTNVKCNGNGYTVLHLAVKNNNLDTVEYLIKHGVDTDIKCSDGYTALHMAVENDYLNIIRCLVKNGADTNIKYTDGYTVLQLTAKNDKFDTFKCLVELGANINATDDQGLTAIHYAASRRWVPKQGSEDILKYSLELGVDINVKDNEGRTALHVAAENGNFNIVEKLIELGADINATDSKHLTAIHYAALCDRSVAKQSNPKIMKYLTKLGLDINEKDDKSRSALLLATEHGLFENVKCLVELGADINTRDNKDLAALHYVALRKSYFAEQIIFDIIKYLLELGIDVNIRDGDGCTGLHMAAKNGYFNTVKCFVEFGADIHAADNNGLTVLHHACLFQNSFIELGGGMGIVNFLLELGASASTRDREGRTALHLAAGKGSWSSVKYLTEFGANINATDTNGLSVMHHAVLGDAPAIVMYFLDMEINVINGDIIYSDPRLSIITFLIRRGADINIKDSYGETTATLAKRLGHLHLLKYLNLKGE